MRIAWITDPHLNFCGDLHGFFRSVAESAPDAVLVGGDFTEAPRLEQLLSRFEKILELPIYFVLGNHDFYRGSIRSSREVAGRMSSDSPLLHWLPTVGVVRLTDSTALVGHGGWADGRLGDYAGSGVRLNDHRLIEDFVGRNSRERLTLMQELADEGARHLERVIPDAIAECRRLVVLTHVPPFRGATWHEGRISGPDYLPHFSCKATGDVLLRAARSAPEREFLVLCGHTHSPGYCQPFPNLHVVTGGATYGAPVVQAVFDVDGPMDSILAAARGSGV